MTCDTDRALLDIMREVGGAEGFPQALDALLERATPLVPCDGLAVMWRNEEHLEVLAAAGATAPLRGLILPAEQIGAARAALDGRRPFAVSDTAQDTHWPQVPGGEKVRAWLGVPLLVRGQVIGLMEWTAARPRDWTAEEVVLARRLADYVAPLLHRLQLLDDTRRRLRERQETEAALLAQAVDLTSELQPLVREALEFAAAEDAFIFLPAAHRGRLRCVAAAGRRRDRLCSVTLRGDGTLEGWSVPLAEARSGGGPTDREVMARLGIERTLILPLRVGGEQVGMVGVAEPRRGRTFGQDAIRLMTHLASQASLIIERSRYALTDTPFDYEMIVQSAPLGIGVLTVGGDILLCNPALGRLLSRSDRSLVGRNLPHFLMRSDGQRLLRALEEVSITAQSRQVDARVRSGQGDPRYVRISISLAHISGGTGDGLIVIVEDITPLKILERERVEHLRELREKHAQLKELDALKSKFVSNVSHELRTPLAVIKLYATLARKGRPEKRLHYLQTIEQETHRLETMVENILDLTRMDRQALHISPERLSVAEIVAQVIQVYEERAQKQGIQIRNHVQDDLPPLWADKNHLIQMLTNLVDNALKYTPRGGEVWVAAREFGSDGQRMLEIAVGDTGVGIPEDEQEKVFDRFYRGSNNTPSSTGTGLGLAIVQELMARHNGRVTLRSRVGEGSVFALQFPLTEPGQSEG